jgi:predicted ester cyclase
MTGIKHLVTSFYDEIWNSQNFDVLSELLDDNLSFRGSLGPTLKGLSEFLGYAKSVIEALSDYHCQVDELVVENSSAAAKLTFSGVHVGEFLGYSPTGKVVTWQGAAFFTESEGKFVDIWVLGDLVSLTNHLDEQAGH